MARNPACAAAWILSFNGAGRMVLVFKQGKKRMDTPLEKAKGKRQKEKGERRYRWTLPVLFLLPFSFLLFPFHRQLVFNSADSVHLPRYLLGASALLRS